MKRAEFQHGEDYLWFDTPVDENGEYETWLVHVNFLLSNWTCIYAQGCPGLTPANQNRYFDDVGCCKLGAWFSDTEDYEHTEQMMSELTDEDWDAEQRAYVEKNGFAIVYKQDEDEINAKTRVNGFGCVFANRNDGSVGKTGKTGCAFHHLAERTGRDHVDTMPWVCWQLPIKYDYNEELEAHTIYPWNVDQWGEPDEDGSHDSMSCWWCVDSPEAYVGEQSVYRTMERELRKIMKDEVYEQMVPLLEARAPSLPMPGATRNDGRPLLPLLIGNRTPYRSPSATNTPNVIEQMRKTNAVEANPADTPA